MKSIFDPQVYSEVKNRVNNLSENSVGQWGKMDVGQMLHHCQGPLNIVLEKNDYSLKPNWFLSLLFKKSFYNDKPWRKNLPTIKAFKILEAKDFSSEKAKLISLVDEVHQQRDRTDWRPHPAFGEFTAEQWGKMTFKHLDHHLTQFGV